MIADEFNKQTHPRNRPGLSIDYEKVRTLALASLTGSMTKADIEAHENLPEDQKSALQQILQFQQM